MITDKHFSDLDEKGYTVVENVVSPDDCDQAISEYRKWLECFGVDRFPVTYNSLIWNYNVAHLDTTWKLRLATKPVFAQIWKTDKLLTCFGSIAIGRPPEESNERFQEPGDYWLHVDVTPGRVGVHAYQGGLYLEEQDEGDWNFMVLEGSHKHLMSLFDEHPERADSARSGDFEYRLRRDDIIYFKERGCHARRVPVTKGGMALWDSRLVHAAARPLEGRKNAGRWRWATFVSMTPAIWANERDLSIKRHVYDQVCSTTHWSSQCISNFTTNTYNFEGETV
ncbi:hypothetical protein MAR_005089 [Mya arenaria]|uniref:Phytanoyl-CoA dioxygenase n=1 Tax=Mya arenaria TaxID=6604 RepID=A0ABY7F0W1_MYAAR|nr:hypothetical protein MAR_005089 [Mya arenaria]